MYDLRVQIVHLKPGARLWAAAQGAQANDPNHADGAIFTGPDQSVKALQDEVRQYCIH